MKLLLKGKVLVNGRFHDFRITLDAPIECCDFIGDFLRKKLQQRGWTPNVP